MMKKGVLKNLNRALFLILVIVLVWTYFSRNNYRGVDEIHPDVLTEPMQTRLLDRSKVSFEQDDYLYELTPLYEYEINGLIVHMMDYRWFSIYKRDSVFPVDLCLLWGQNVESGVYKNRNLKFSQDARFAYWSWYGDIEFNNHEAANVHLILKDEGAEKVIKSLNCGDQVKVKGKLVDIEAKNIGKPGKYDPPHFTMSSSTKRTDTGAGACEIVYVEELKILKKANVLSNSLFKMSLYTLLILLGANIILFFIL